MRLRVGGRGSLVWAEPAVGTQPGASGLLPESDGNKPPVYKETQGPPSPGPVDLKCPDPEQQPCCAPTLYSPPAPPAACSELICQVHGFPGQVPTSPENRKIKDVGK